MNTIHEKFFKLFFLSLLFTLVVTASSFGQVERKCSDPIPRECNTVRYLGEIDGCACFVCNPGSGNEQNVCTRDRRVKDELMSKPKR